MGKGHLQLDKHVVFFGQSAQVDDGIAHSAEGGVDADAGACGNVFEVAFAIVAEYHYAALFGGQHLDQFADVAAGLLAHDALLDVVVVQLQCVDDVVVGTIGDDGHFAVAAEVVHNEVVGYAHDPVDKLVLVFVGTAVDGGHYFEESVLKDIVGHVLVLHNRENIAINLGLVAGKEYIETGGIAISITLYQLVVGERRK